MATALTKPKPMTADEFYDFVHQPGNEDRHFELERGEVIELPPPGKVHGFVCGRVVALLNAYAVKVGQGYVCCNDTGVIVEEGPDTVRGADVAFYIDDEDIDTMERRYSHEPPRLIVEVLSPSDKPGRVVQRTSQYLKCGVGLVWIVDPDIRSVTTHRKGREQQTLVEGDVLTGESALSKLEVRVDDLFARPGPQKSSKSPRKNGPGKRKPKGKK